MRRERPGRKVYKALLDHKGCKEHPEPLDPRVDDGVAFDGANIWVTNLGGDSITKLRASDGINLGTFPAGSGPYAVAFDGANIWVANITYNNVIKLRASDGATLETFPAASGPVAVAFDGANIWVANLTNNTVSKF